MVGGVVRRSGLRLSDGLWLAQHEVLGVVIGRCSFCGGMGELESVVLGHPESLHCGDGGDGVVRAWRFFECGACGLYGALLMELENNSCFGDGDLVLGGLFFGCYFVEVWCNGC